MLRWRHYGHDVLGSADSGLWRSGECCGSVKTEKDVERRNPLAVELGDMEFRLKQVAKERSCDARRFFDSMLRCHHPNQPFRMGARAGGRRVLAWGPNSLMPENHPVCVQQVVKMLASMAGRSELGPCCSHINMCSWHLNGTTMQ